MRRIEDVIDDMIENWTEELYEAAFSTKEEKNSKEETTENIDYEGYYDDLQRDEEDYRTIEI